MNPHLQPWLISAEDFPVDACASDRLEFLLGYAVLAPSPHNTQPWLFRINVNDVEVFRDCRRALHVVDPRERESTLSCGAVLCNLRVAAEYFGNAYSVELLPPSDAPDLLARLTLHQRSETSSEDVLLFYALTQRRTNREAYQPEPLPEEVLADLRTAAELEGAWLEIISSDEGREAVAALVAEADKAQWRNREFRRELASWVRTETEHQADGIPTRELGVRDWMAFAGPALIRTFNRGNNQAAHDVEIARQSPALAVLGTDGDDPRSWLEAGQALERVLLQAQADGISVSHLNQPVEVEALRPQLASLVGRGGYPQIVLRLGYGPEVPHTPRRSVRGFLIKHDMSSAPPH